MSEPAPRRPSPLWEPSERRIADSGITAFRGWLREHRNLVFDSYDDLWHWSVTDIEGFWQAVWDWAGVSAHTRPTAVLTDRSMPGARWFPGARLNYAEHALSGGRGRAAGAPALVFEREDGLESVTTYGQLRSQVAAVAAALREHGVGKGDVVAALLPNCPQAVVAFLATASVGAIWASCSPEFAAHSVRERFAQLEPKVLISVDAYRYGGTTHGVLHTLREVRRALPTLTTTVVVPYAGTAAGLTDIRQERVLLWAELLAHPGRLRFEPVEFDHPLWVLFSSGTTGLPKGIVHGHGGILVEHYKALGLHLDVREGTRLFWFTTTGWMMWNFLVSGLLLGATLVLYDGSPAIRDMDVLWRLAEETRTEIMGVSAPYLQACMKAGVEPSTHHDLSAVRMVGSTGAPLSPEGFRWVRDHVGPDAQVASQSGGTDVCTSFVGPVSVRPVYLGEIQCRMLGCAVAAWDSDGRSVVDEVGELVVTEPMPSMPVALWGDSDGSRLREAYYDFFPGVWRHGDWVRITERGGVVITGRSDATLNRGGVRMGTAEFYRVVEALPEVADSLVVDLSRPGEDGELVLFVVPAGGGALDDELVATLRSTIRSALSPRHVPNRIEAVPAVPRTLNGKKCEVPVKRILLGEDPATAVSTGALADPSSLDVFVAMARGAA